MGSVIQLFKEVTSVVIDVQVEPSHFSASTFGKVVDSEYAAVQADDVGSVMQLFKGVKSECNEAIAFGIVLEAL